MSDFTILVEEYGTGHAVAAIKNGMLIDFLIDPKDKNESSLVGSIVTVKLNAVKKGINGTFVTLPGEKKGFLKGRHNLQAHSILPVYIGVTNDAYKAQPVSRQLFLKGRYVILTPDRPGINLSRKISSEDIRNNIQDALSKFEFSFLNKLGLIVRSQAAHVTIIDLIKEVEEKMAQYNLIIEDNLSEPRTIIPPLKARDFAMLEWNYVEPYSYIEEESCFDRFSIWEQLYGFLRSRVDLQNGGFVIIEPTSALIAVDINTGSDVSYAGALKTNLFAMKELPRQLEVRGLGGKIIVEFAPLFKSDRIKIEAELQKALKKYKTQCILVGWTKLGNLELQKKRDKKPIAQMLKHDKRYQIF